MWMLSHLTQQTQQHHPAATSDRLAILERPTVERYRAHLTRIYRFEAPVEAACAATDGIDRAILGTHCKTDRLAADLRAVGVSIDGFDQPVLHAPHFTSPVEALAWLWVLHRNTLVHGLIYHCVSDRLPDTARAAAGYFSVFEGRASALMRDLSIALEHTVRRVAAVECAVAAAHAAFRAQRQWYATERESPEHPPHGPARPDAPPTEPWRAA